MGMLQVEPADELVLEGPFNRAVCKKLKVYNPSKHTRVAFKLKTTTPRLFFVRPNVGLVQPGERVTIDIFVHPVYQDYNTQRHKFLMQAAEANENIDNLQEFWKTINPVYIWDTKIRVKFVDESRPMLEAPPSGDATGATGATGAAGGTGAAGATIAAAVGKPDEGINAMASLMQRVSLLEMERESLMQKVDELTKENEQQKLLALKHESSIFRSALPLFILIGIVCGILGYQGYV